MTLKCSLIQCNPVAVKHLKYLIKIASCFAQAGIYRLFLKRLICLWYFSVQNCNFNALKAQSVGKIERQLNQFLQIVDK